MTIRLKPRLKGFLTVLLACVVLPLYALEGEQLDEEVEQKLDDFMAQEMVAAGAMLPHRLDQYSIITFATYMPQMNTVIYGVEIDDKLEIPDQDLAEAQRVTREQGVTNACLITDVRILLQMGITLKYNYYAEKTGDDLFSYDVVASDCGVETLTKYELFSLLD